MVMSNDCNVILNTMQVESDNEKWDNLNRKKAFSDVAEHLLEPEEKKDEPVEE